MGLDPAHRQALPLEAAAPGPVEGLQDLDGDLSTEGHVLGPVDIGEPTGADVIVVVETVDPEVDVVRHPELPLPRLATDRPGAERRSPVVEAYPVGSATNVSMRSSATGSIGPAPIAGTQERSGGGAAAPSAWSRSTAGPGTRASAVVRMDQLKLCSCPRNRSWLMGLGVEVHVVVGGTGLDAVEIRLVDGNTGRIAAGAGLDQQVDDDRPLSLWGLPAVPDTWWMCSPIMAESRLRTVSW